jgi:hypothetical protein
VVGGGKLCTEIEKDAEKGREQTLLTSWFVLALPTFNDCNGLGSFRATAQSKSKNSQNLRLKNQIKIFFLYSVSKIET